MRQSMPIHQRLNNLTSKGPDQGTLRGWSVVEGEGGEGEAGGGGV
jgi:hypothetical protein